MNGVRRLAAAVMATGIAGLAASGCGVPHPGISNGSLTACYRAIPTATAALHTPHAKLRSVHRVSADTAAKYLPPSNQIRGETDTVVCAVAFEGDFAAGHVEKANPTAHGKYAIVLVTSRHLDVLASFVLDRLPKRFKGRII